MHTTFLISISIYSTLLQTAKAMWQKNSAPLTRPGLIALTDDEIDEQYAHVTVGACVNIRP